MKTSKKIWFLILGSFSFVVSLASADQKILIDSTNKKILIQSGNQTFSSDNLPKSSLENTSWSTSTDKELSKSTTQPEEIKKTSDTLHNERKDWTELEKALYRMYQNGLTKYDTLEGYRPDDFLLREEATKIIGQAYHVLKLSPISSETNCSFVDSESFDPSLSSFITSTCKAGIFKWSHGKFLPHNTLSKAEALTVLIRILEWKLSSEKFNPRWTLYFAKAKGISLTNESDVMNLDRAISRREIALLIYRLKTILLDQKLHNAAKSQLSTIDTNPWNSLITTGINSQTSSKTENQTSSNEIIGLLSGSGLDSTNSLSILNSPEVNEAIQRMRDHNLTNAKNISDYQPFSTLTREQAAKMFTQFAKALNFKPISWGTNQCNFKDLSKADKNLKSSVEEACKRGLMQGNNSIFEPQLPLTKAQFITMLIRLSENKKLDESWNPWRSAYFQKAKELWILNNEDALTFEAPITRYEAALLFFRFQVKQKIISHINTETLKNELISTKRTNDWNFATGDKEGSYAVAFDINLLKNQFFQAGFVELLGTRYELKKTSMTVFDIGEESYVRYWDLINLEKENKIWTVSFVVSNGNLVQGTIRLLQKNETWLIKESSSTNARFNLIKA